MDKTIKINLAGTIFQIEEDAYHMLRDYLHAVNSRFQNVPGGNETIEDIESRIAEIFRSQQNIAGVISKANVEAMIGIIGKPEDFEVPEQHGDPVYSSSTRRRLYRNPEDTVISGVCGGIGAYLNNDPVWIRIAFILFTAFFGIGFFVYLALWIAIPVAHSEYQKRELYGEYYHRMNLNSDVSHLHSYSNGAGGAFSEIFSAIGKFFYLVFRIVMIMLGIALVATGFFALLAVFMIFFLRDPGLISMGTFNSNLFFLQDFLNFIVSPALTPWIIVLSFIALSFPLFALIYWGIKMIFWFSVRDGVVSLILFIIWVLSVSALSIILVNEGVSFSKTGLSTSQEILQNKRDTLYVITDRKVKDLSVTKEFTVPDNQYSMFITEPAGKLSVRSGLSLYVTDEKFIKIEVRKNSCSHSKTEAVKKAESLTYNCRVSNDTLYLDEYFTVPSDRKWSADHINVRLYLPEKTVVFFDNTSENLFPERVRVHSVNYDRYTGSENYSDTESWQLGNKFWVISEEGLRKSAK